MSADTSDYRARIDKIDEEIIKLFSQRMEVSEQIAAYKKENGLPILDLKREREKVQMVTEQTPEKYRGYTPEFMRYIMELSRSCQHKLYDEAPDITRSIKEAVERTPLIFPERASVACQGIDGANSQIACDRIFKNANIMFFSGFKGVFKAVEKGLCRYAVLPIENSTAGSVNSVYDLMMDYKFKIVRSIRVKIEHNLLAQPGTKLEDIKEIFSHPQAIGQCNEFLSSLKDVKVTPCENTAIAAKNVSESERKDVAAISSSLCMKYYDLDCVRADIQDQSNNYTRFIVISKELEIYPGAHRTSVMAVLPHEAGSLYKLLARINALGINLVKLESRPLPEKEFEFMFYLDLDMPVYAPEIPALMGELHEVCESFEYLGSYSEVI